MVPIAAFPEALTKTRTGDRLARGGFVVRHFRRVLPMLKLYVRMQNFLAEPIRRDERGATAVEYGLLVALIAAVIITVVTTLGTKLSSMFNNVTNGL
jgi:pilus assembly protein Flp/PilA